MSDELENIRQQIASARAMTEQKKQQVAEINAQLNQEKQALPDIRSQQALRQKFGGLSGRNQRFRVQQAEEDVSGRMGQLSEYSADLNQYEQEQLIPAENQIREYDAEVAGYNLAVKFYNKKVPYQFVDDPYTRKYLKQMYEEGSAQDAFNAKLQDAVTRYNSGEPLDVAFKGMNVEYLKKKGFLKFEAPTQPEITSAKDLFNTQFNSKQSFSDVLQMSSRLPRNTAVQVQEPSKSIFNQPILPLVSARPVGEVRALEPTSTQYKNLFKKNVEQSGYVKGFLAFAGDVAQGVYSKYQRQAIRSGDVSAGYNQEAFRNIASLAPSVVAYATPYLGEALLIGGGVETAIKAPTIKEKALGVAEAGLGTFSGALRVRNAINVRQIPQTRFASEIEPLTDSVSTIRTISETRLGKQTAFGLSEARLKQLESGQSVVVGERNLVLRPLSNGKLEIQRFNLLGKGESLGTASIIRTRNGLRVGFDAGEGVRATSITRNTGRVVSRNGRIIESKLPTYEKTKSSVTGSMNPLKEENTFGFFGSDRPTKLRIYRGGEPRLVTSKPNIFGVVKRVQKPQTFTEFFDIIGQESAVKTIQKQQQNSILSQVSALSSKSSSILKPMKYPTATSIPPFVGAVGQTQTAKQSSVPITQNIFLQPTPTKTSQKDTQNIATALINPQRVKQLAGQLVKEKQRYVQSPTSMQSPASMTGLKSMLGLSQVQNSKQRLRQAQATQQQNIFRTPTAKTPFFPITSSVAYKTSGGKVVKVGGRYLVMVRRFGQDNVVAEASTLSEAKKILSYNLRTTLSASGFIQNKETRQKEDVSNLFGDMFTSSKRDSRRLVQKRGKRLSSMSEIWGIQSARNSKRKNKKFSWW